MLLVIIFALCSTGSSSITDTFSKNGLQYEKIGKAKLIDGSRTCNSRKFSILTYTNALTMSEASASNTDFVILRAQLQQTFHNICSSFNLTTEHAPAQYEPSILNAQPLGYLDRFHLKWNVKKFANDLITFLLYNKISSPFHALIDEEWLDDDIDMEEFVEKTLVFPTRCESTHMVVVAKLCSDFEETALEGDLYAIAHTGQMMEKSNAFVFYDVPEYVLVNGDDVTAVEFESCRVVNGSSFVCTEKDESRCDVSMMKSCDIYVEPISADFSFTRPFGTGMIIATNQRELTIAGSAVYADSPIFSYHISQKIEKDEDGREQLVQSAIDTPISSQVSFPELCHSAEEAVRTRTKAIRLYHVNRKGVPMLCNQHGKASVWEDVRDFFLHLI
ncbi:hypothetical protein RB195_017611 [Necator americanus]